MAFLATSFSAASFMPLQVCECATELQLRTGSPTVRKPHSHFHSHHQSPHHLPCTSSFSSFSLRWEPLPPRSESFARPETIFWKERHVVIMTSVPFLVDQCVTSLFFSNIYSHRNKTTILVMVWDTLPHVGPYIFFVFLLSNINTLNINLTLWK